MGKNSVAGEWRKLFGERREYRLEIQRAEEIEADWLDRGRHVDIVLADIPGRAAPLWGTDGEWLYLPPWAWPSA